MQLCHLADDVILLFGFMILMFSYMILLFSYMILLLNLIIATVIFIKKYINDKPMWWHHYYFCYLWLQKAKMLSDYGTRED